MGQRMQCFIKLENPIRKGRNPFGEYKQDMVTRKFPFVEDTAAKKGLGGRKYTVLAYHHQWLYGRCAAFIAQDLMKLASSYDANSDDLRIEYSHLLSPEIATNTGSMSFQEYGNLFANYMGIIKDPKFPRGIGFERFHFLNIEEPYMRENFTRGDNNDGVLIVDTVSKKYCFMNIFDETDPESTSVQALPSMTPSSAIEYVNAYYPTEESNLSTYVREDEHHCNNEPKKIQALLRTNKKIVAEIEKMFKDYQILSLDEVKEIFPKVFVEKEEIKTT